MSRTAKYILAVALATLVVFAPLCGHEFTWFDDFATIHQNEALNPPTWRSLKHYWTNVAYGLYAPLTYTVWIGLASIARVAPPHEHNIQLNPWIFHSANVLVHVVAAVAALALLRRLTKRDGAALIGALVFALHPVQVEPVGWVSGLKDVLSGCLSLVALWRYVVRAERKYGDPIVPDVWGSIAFIAAMLAKSSAFMVPALAIAIDRFVLGRGWKVVLRANLIWLMLAVVFAVIARRAQDVTGIYSPPLWARTLIAGDSYAFYLCKLLFPIWLGVDYGRRPEVVMRSTWFFFAWILPTVVAVLVWLARRRAPWLVAAALCFALPVLPVSGLAVSLFQFTSTVADHYLYVAMLGPALALAFALREFGNVRRYAIVTVVLVMLAARSLVQTFVWENDETLFNNAVAVNPDSFLGHNNLGHWYGRHGVGDRAIEEYRAAIAANPEYPDAYSNLIDWLLATGDVKGAIQAAEKLIAIRSRYPAERYAKATAAADHVRIAQMYTTLGRTGEAIAHLETALKLDPNLEEARKGLEEARRRDGG